MTQVFISYSRTDMDFVRRLALDLQSAGVDVWWDLSDIQGSDVWERKIEEGLRSSQYFIIVLTPASLESRWVRREYLTADNKGLKIIPLKLKNFDDAPLTLRDIQPIEAINRMYEDVLADVLSVLKIESQAGSVTGGDRGVPSSSLAGAISPKVSSASAPIELLDLVGLILPIIYFILTGLDVLHLLTGDEAAFVLGVSAILSAFYFFFKRQIGSGLPIKFSLILYLLAHSVVAYSNNTGSGIDFLPEKIEGLAALLIAGLLFANLRSYRKPAPYASIMFGVFLLLVGAKTLINLFGSYPPGIYTFIILSGIITSIVLWLDQ